MLRIIAGGGVLNEQNTHKPRTRNQAHGQRDNRRGRRASQQLYRCDHHLYGLYNHTHSHADNAQQLHGADNGKHLMLGVWQVSNERNRESVQRKHNRTTADHRLGGYRLLRAWC